MPFLLCNPIPIPIPIPNPIPNPNPNPNPKPKPKPKPKPTPIPIPIFPPLFISPHGRLFCSDEPVRGKQNNCLKAFKKKSSDEPVRETK